MTMSDDDEIEIVCVRVLFSSFAPFLCLQKKQKNSHQNAVVLDFNDRMRNKFLPDGDKSVKKEERFSHEREREKRRETREPSHYTTKKIVI